ncbi:uncharacterized protein LOC5517188 isoform X2 [Nematostella vectensis]|uniref:uncharacterized protein LOC5517188 isoform X2 n=1 Tax=Nematostella vectensis TaxID=45351 RepID=UPI00207702BD|nr:uncharacterized protein LOC5517188 isoform X2 [Nematostella vectensis]
MDKWKCEACNMKFESQALYHTHKMKFCVMKLPRSRDRSNPARQTPFSCNQTLLSHKQRSPRSSPAEDQRISALEKEKIQELKALKSSMSLERAASYGQRYCPEIPSPPYQELAYRTSRQSRESSPSGGRGVFEDKLGQLQRNHKEQLEQLKEQNKRLLLEKQGIQQRMKTLGLKSREKMVSQASVDRQAAELEGLKTFLGYKKNELSANYEVEMSKSNDVLKLQNTESKSPVLGSPSGIRVPSLQKNPSTEIVPFNPSKESLPMAQVYHSTFGIPSQHHLAFQSSQTDVLTELNALRASYLHAGGNDPVLLSQIQRLEMEAQQVRATQRPAAMDPVLQQQIMAYHLANQRLEQELQMIRSERQGQTTHSKSPDLSPEFRQLKAEHLEKMTALRHESELLKQMTEIERMKRELQQMRDDKADTEKQNYETPFMMTTSGMEKNLLPSPYDPSAGFSVFWDFILGLSSTHTKCRLAVGIYNGTDLISDVKVLPTTSVTQLTTQQHPSVPAGGVAVLGATHPFPKCAPLPTLSVVVELQANNTTDPEDSGKLFSRGWAKMNLFDASDRLISGRWKIPFRVPPIKTYLNTYELNRIPQAGASELFIRLVNARDIRAEEALTPEPVQQYLYKFPPMENPVAYNTFAGNRLQPPLTAATTIHPPVPPPSVPPPPDTPGAESLASVRSATPGDPSLLGFQVDQLYDAIGGEARIKITAYNQHSGEVLHALGDTPVTCVTKEARQDFLHGICSFGLQEAVYRHVQWNAFSVVVLRVYLRQSNNSKRSPTKALDEANLVAWTLVPLASPPLPSSRHSRGRSGGSGSEARLNVGSFKLPLYFPPVPEVQSLPVQSTDVPDSWVRYGAASVRFTIFSGVSPPPDRPLTPAEYTDENDPPPGAWIKYGRPSLPSQPFEAGNGFDLYIDGARFLPDSVTFTKVTGRVLDRNYEKIGPDIEVQAKLSSDVFNPEYDCRLEFREPVLPATSTLMVKMYTVDRVTKKLSCVGYSVLPVFLQIGTTKQPVADTGDNKVALNDGAHQIRIYNGTPNLSQPMSEDIINQLTPIPCASLLVRILRAACHPNGKPKEASQFKESAWEKEGLLDKKHNYSEGCYYSLLCEPGLGESQVLHSMFKRQPISARESVKLIDPEQSSKKDQVISSWIKTQLTRHIDSAPGNFNPNFVALYHPLHGLAVSIDAAQNLPWSHVTLASYCFSPPAAFYKGDRQDVLGYSAKLQSSSDINSPQWKSGIKVFRRRSYHRFLTLIIHVHELTLDISGSQETWALKGQAWTPLQVFHEGYVLGGCYQLPLYSGEPTEAVLSALETDNCEDIMASFLRKKTVTYIEGASVFVRMSDARRIDELPQPKTRPRQYHLPQDKLQRYITTVPSQPLSAILPQGLSEDLTDVFQELLLQVFSKYQKSNSAQKTK